MYFYSDKFQSDSVAPLTCEGLFQGPITEIRAGFWCMAVQKRAWTLAALREINIMHMESLLLELSPNKWELAEIHSWEGWSPAKPEPRTEAGVTGLHKCLQIFPELGIFIVVVSV